MSETSDSGGKDEDGFLAAEYALGVLTPAEHATVGARLRAEPALRADVRFWRQRLSGLDVQFAETTAPAGVWPALERRLFAEARQGGFWSSLALWRGLTAGAFAVAAIAIGINLTTPRGVDPKLFASQLVAAIQASGGTDVSFVAIYNPATGSVRLASLSGSPVPDKDYELWAIEGDKPPVSMGVIKIDARSDVKIPEKAMAGWGEGTTLAITLEAAGGSPTGAPQGPVVAAGKATQI